MIQPSIKTINDLQGWFVQCDKPAWLLYAGNRITQASTPLAVNFTIEDLSGSWTELQLTLSRMGNIGTFTLVVRASKKDSAGAHSTVIELNPNYQAPQQMQGINGFGYNSQPQPMQGLNEISPTVKQHIDKEVNDKLAIERRLMQSEFDMKMLKLQMANKETATDKLIGAFVKSPEKMLLGIGSILRGNTAQLGVLTDDSEVPPVTETPPTPNTKQPLDFNKVNQSAIVLYNAGITDIGDVLLKMAQKAQANPSEAVEQFEMLKRFL